MNELIKQFEEIYVLFPPTGNHKLEFSFFLNQEGERFYEHYNKSYEYWKYEYPIFCDTYEKYLKNFLLPSLKEFKDIKLGLDSFSGKTSWFGDKRNDEEYGINIIPPVDFNYYKGAVMYKNFVNY